MDMNQSKLGRILEIGLVSGKTFPCAFSDVRFCYHNGKPFFVEIQDPDLVTRIAWDAVAYIIYERKKDSAQAVAQEAGDAAAGTA